MEIVVSHILFARLLIDVSRDSKDDINRPKQSYIRGIDIQMVVGVKLQMIEWMKIWLFSY